MPGYKSSRQASIKTKIPGKESCSLSSSSKQI
jgi:hypothetical protein